MIIGEYYASLTACVYDTHVILPVPATCCQWLDADFFSKMAMTSDTATTSIKKLPTIFQHYVLADDISGMFKCTVDLL